MRALMLDAPRQRCHRHPHALTSAPVTRKPKPGNRRTDLQSYLRLPHRLVLVRHGESLGNVDDTAYTRIPDPQIPLTERGRKQAQLAGANVVQIMDDNIESPREGMPRAYFILSPYRRSKETFENMRMAFRRGQVVGAQEEVQLREQDVRVKCGAARRAECLPSRGAPPAQSSLQIPKLTISP